jgi:uncharacterized protein YdaU (DUF1376 family)
MHYYQFHIGDYRAATAHLTNEEDLAYRRLLDMLYDTEQPIPNDLQWVARRIRLEASVIRDVLNDMFSKNENGTWFSPRADAEIAAFKGKQEQASKAGKASAQRRMNGSSTDVQPEATDSQPTINHKPLTINHLIQGAAAPLSETSFPTCPHTKILELWQKHLPHLTQHRSWEGSRQATLRQRWVQAGRPSTYSPNGYKTLPEGLAWWDSFFAYIANDTKLAAGFESQGRTWRPDLEWIINATNFAKIIDGKYNK